MIVIGADTHKHNHALAAVNSGTGVVVDELQITADEDGHLHALAWAAGLGAEIVWALEDCRLVAGKLERALIAAGQRVIRVPPRLMGQSRRGEREIGKSDRIDARAIARAVLKDGVEHFPAAFLDEDALDIRLLHDHRSALVGERSRQINRLRWQLVALCPELEAELPSRSLRHEPHITRVARRLARIAPAARVRIAKQLTASIRSLTRQINQLEHELDRLAHRAQPRPARRDRHRRPHRGHADRSHRRRRALPDRRALRAAGRSRAQPRVLGTNRAAPPRPRRRPPDQLRAAHDRPHAHAPGPRHPRLRPAPQGRGQDHPRDPSLPEALDRPLGLEAPARVPDGPRSASPT